jgi:hypothetical protein
MRLLLCAALAGATFATLTSSPADDSSAALGLGGITFEKSADIRMAQEDLWISPEKVKIRFAFANDSKKDIDTTVAFPLPDIDTWEYFEVPLGTVTDDPVNFVGFKVVVNGKPVAFKSDQRAIHRGRDVTATLKAAGVPVNVLMGNIQILDKVPAAAKKTLRAAGLIEVEGDYIHPKWVIRTRFHWKQKFPAGKTVVIEHSYQPVTGGTFFTNYEMAGNEGGRLWRRDYCMDPPTLTRIRKMLHKAARANNVEEPNGMLQITSTQYILSTGNNWKGGIGRFHLVLDKLKPEYTLSLCWDGELRKTSATTFEFRATDYRPTRDVKMVVLR